MIAIEDIGPTEAEGLLALNVKNRHISQKIVQSLARDMASGEWQMNGESVKVSNTNKLLDGQHRLLAIIKSGATVPLLIVRGLDDESQATVDIGMRRMFADVLQLEGEANAHNLAAAVRTAWFMDKFQRTSVASVAPSQSELHQWLDDNGQIRLWLPVGRTVAASAVRYIPSLATALAFLMGRVNLLQSEGFWESLAHGGERSGSPVHALRETLLRDVGAARRMSVADRAAVTIKMWNYMRDGRNDVKLAVFKSTEQFPVIK